MKTFSNKSNAKRAAVKQIAKDTGLTEAEVKAKADELFRVTPAEFEEGRFVWAAVADSTKDQKEALDEELSEGNSRREMTYNEAGDAVPVEPKPVKTTARIKAERGLDCEGAGTSKPAATGIKIEKNREEQNGVKRPSIGGVCRAVWDACDAFRLQTGRSPMPKEIKELAAEEGWNQNNASIEMYQWRKFNGIKGRIK